MFHKVLIANRGEIAVRVMRACREMRIRTVAVYSDVDRDALHVRFSDEAYPIGPPPARESYLVGERIVEVAKRAGAEAIHPGYGFLSERGEFADLCEKSGVVFIGPRGDVMRAMGDKVTARQTMERAGVPIVPGTTERLSDEALARWVGDIGPPVMIKAAAGGGGKGMRLVRSESELAAAIARARSEARSSFGDDSLYVEKFVEEPRHIEIQLLADAHGNAVHLFERECSIQRRHQKVIEEAPGNRIHPTMRAKMGEAAVAAARAVGYVGAGTCEFLVDRHDHFYFLEMNTRVQVEHPITEMITGVDIVKAQIRVAAGAPLGLRQEELDIRGHAIEARIYAEDPDHNFVPSPGEIVVYRPAGGPGVRVDSGVYQGARVTVFYDPMVAKLVVWGCDRQEAIERLRRALSEFVVKGIKTSIPFHQKVVHHPVFLEGHYDTGFIEQHLGGGRGKVPPAVTSPDEDLVEARRVAFLMAAIAAYRRDKERAAAAAAVPTPGGPHEPWKVFGRRAQMRGGLR
jgi:acetyl-CoA carboxylase biotin carboxylase subunit